MDSGRFIYANRILHKLLAEMERAKSVHEYICVTIRLVPSQDKR